MQRQDRVSICQCLFNLTRLHLYLFYHRSLSAIQSVVDNIWKIRWKAQFPSRSTAISAFVFTRIRTCPVAFLGRNSNTKIKQVWCGRKVSVGLTRHLTVDQVDFSVTVFRVYPSSSTFSHKSGWDWLWSVSYTKFRRIFTGERARDRRREEQDRQTVWNGKWHVRKEKKNGNWDKSRSENCLLFRFVVFFSVYFVMSSRKILRIVRMPRWKSRVWRIFTLISCVERKTSKFTIRNGLFQLFNATSLDRSTAEDLD